MRGGKTSYVYFLRPVGKAGPVKIGCSNNVPARMAQLNNWSPDPLEVAAFCRGDAVLEAWLHLHFVQFRRHGEWFNENAELKQVIERVAAGEDIEKFLILPPFERIKRMPNPKRAWGENRRRAWSYHFRFINLHYRAIRNKTTVRVPSRLANAAEIWMRNHSSGYEPPLEQIAAMDAFFASVATVGCGRGQSLKIAGRGIQITDATPPSPLRSPAPAPAHTRDA